MIQARLRKNLDFPLLGLALLLAAVGILTIYSATREAPDRNYQKQIVWALLGTGLLVGAASFNYQRLARWTRSLYIANIGLLVFVLVKGKNIKGAQRWFDIGSFRLQPSELAKIIMIVCLAAFLVSRLEKIKEPGTLALSLAYLALPMALIMKQPDMGTSLVLLAIWFGMTYIAGARWQHLAIVLLGGAVLFAGMWKFGVIKPFQKDRLSVFLNADADPGGIGYQVRQSRIAIGSGQVTGKGFGKGTQARGRFIPENHTDFIFTVLGEEGGFVECAVVLALFAGLLYRGAIAIYEAGDPLGRLMAAGIVSMFAFHVIVNLGMTMGVMPVTGVPLPLISYGGSSLLLNLTAIGLLLGIGMRRHSLVF